MTIGPAPMIRIDLISVRFGIALRATAAFGGGKFDNGHTTKGRAFLRVLLVVPGGADPARGVLRPESAAKGRATHGLVTVLSETRRGCGRYCAWVSSAACPLQSRKPIFRPGARGSLWRRPMRLPS